MEKTLAKLQDELKEARLLADPALFSRFTETKRQLLTATTQLAEAQDQLSVLTRRSNTAEEERNGLAAKLAAESYAHSKRSGTAVFASAVRAAEEALFAAEVDCLSVTEIESRRKLDIENAVAHCLAVVSELWQQACGFSHTSAEAVTNLQNLVAREAASAKEHLAILEMRVEAEGTRAESLQQQLSAIEQHRVGLIHAGTSPIEKWPAVPSMTPGRAGGGGHLDNTTGAASLPLVLESKASPLNDSCDGSPAVIMTGKRFLRRGGKAGSKGRTATHCAVGDKAAAGIVSDASHLRLEAGSVSDPLQTASLPLVPAQEQGRVSCPPNHAESQYSEFPDQATAEQDRPARAVIVMEESADTAKKTAGTKRRAPRQKAKAAAVPRVDGGSDFVASGIGATDCASGIESESALVPQKPKRQRKAKGSLKANADEAFILVASPQISPKKLSPLPVAAATAQAQQVPPRRKLYSHVPLTALMAPLPDFAFPAAFLGQPLAGSAAFETLARSGGEPETSAALSASDGASGPTLLVPQLLTAPPKLKRA
jgi:hypothetical protein